MDGGQNVSHCEAELHRWPEVSYVSKRLSGVRGSAVDGGLALQVQMSMDSFPFGDIGIFL